LFVNFFFQSADWSAAVKGFMIYGIIMRLASQQLGRRSFGLTLALALALLTKRLDSVLFKDLVKHLKLGTLLPQNAATKDSPMPDKDIIFFGSLSTQSVPFLPWNTQIVIDCHCI
jgi:hypothetical protein